MPSVIAKEDTAATAGGKKQSVMGRLKSKFTNPLARKKDAAPNEGDLRGMPPSPSQSGLCNQGSTPRLESSGDDDDEDVNIEQHDDDDVNIVDHGEPRDDEILEGATASETALSNNDQPAPDNFDRDKLGEEHDEEVLVSAPGVADLVVIGKTPSKLQASSSPKKRQFPPEGHALESAFAPDSLVSPPETRRSSDKLSSSPLKRPIVHPPVAERAEPIANEQNNRPDVPATKPRKARAVSTFNEDAPILASANAVAADTAAAEPSNSTDAAPEGISEPKPDSDFDAGAAITSVFGERVARLLGADPWGDRQDGFDAISLFAKKYDPTAAGAPMPVAVLTASLAAINCGVVDRVAPVMYCSLECLQNVLGVLTPLTAKSKRLLQHAPLVLQLNALQTSLLAKLNDSNKRTQREAVQGLVRLAKAPRLQTLASLTTVFDSEPLDKSRLDLIHELVAELGHSVVSIDKVLAWTVPALKIADEKTRKLALDIAAAAILQAPDQQAAVESLTGIKPAMLKVLQRRLEELKASQAAPSANQTESMASDGAPEGEEVVELLEVPKEDDASVTTLLATVMREAETAAGPVAWRKLESKTWSDRKEALVDIEKAVEEHKSELRDVKPALGSHTQQQYVAYNGLIHHSLNDSIAPVVSQAIDFYSTLIKIYGAHVDWRDAPVKDLTMQTIMRLLSGMQKPNNRTSKGSCRAILKLARLNTHTMQCVVACVFAKDAEPLVQMQVLRLLVPEFGLTSDPTTDIPGVNIHSTLVLNAVSTALAHSNEKVRKAAMDVALCTQRLIGKTRVLKRLKDVKPATLKELEKNFIEVEPPTVDRPATVQQTPTALGAGLGEVTASRRLLSSAPVAGGKSVDDDGGAMDWTPRGNSILSKDEESFMDSILDG